jgi:hypothetical protein
MMCVTSLIKIGLGIQKLFRGYTYREQGDTISLVLFLQTKQEEENRLKIDGYTKT